MDSLIFAINAVLPIIIMVADGYFLKKTGYMDGAFAKAANRLVFHVFLPVMLFLNVYKIDSIGDIDLGYVLYAACALVAVFILSIPAVLTVTKEPSRRGALVQACFRSNYALIGIPLAKSLFGDEGVAAASLLSAVFIPMLNILAVISLSVFRDGGEKPSMKKILSGILKNPLIRSIALGLLALVLRAVFVKYGVSIRLSDLTPIYTVLEYLSNLATPLALLVLGAQFEFSAVARLRKEIVFGTLMRTVVVPCLGIGVAYFAFRSHFGGAQFATFVAAFATPVAVSSVPMAQEMDGDVTLAGQMVVWSTLFSVISVFTASYLLKSAGVF